MRCSPYLTLDYFELSSNLRLLLGHLLTLPLEYAEKMLLLRYVGGVHKNVFGPGDSVLKCRQYKFGTNKITPTPSVSYFTTTLINNTQIAVDLLSGSRIAAI